MNNLFGNYGAGLGADLYGGSGFGGTDYKQILEQLKSGDEMTIYQAVLNLSNSLHMAQENTLNNFSIDQFITALSDVLKQPPISDFSNEIFMYTIQCLTNLMDIFPTVCNSIVNHGVVKSLATILEGSAGFVDLNEACIKALEKVSLENPHAVLISGTIGILINMMDFFEYTTQSRILNLLLNVSQHASSDQDFNEYILPLMPYLCMMLQMRGAGDNSHQKIEVISSIIIRLCDSTQRFISPHSQSEKLGQVLNQLLQSTGVLDQALQQLQEYTITNPVIGGNNDQQMVDDSQQKSLSNQTIQNYLKIVAYGCRYSMEMTLMAVEQGSIMRTIEQLLPSTEDLKKGLQDLFPFISECINVLDSLIPDREEVRLQAVFSDQAETHRKFLDSQKREFLKQHQALDPQSKVLFLAEKVLPKVFVVYEINIQQRPKCLSIIDRLISIFNDELLNNFIEPYSFAKFIQSSIKSSVQSPVLINLQSILLCVQMIDKVMKSNSKTYFTSLVREGVHTLLQDFKTIEQLEKSLSLNLSQSSVSEESIEELIKSTLQKEQESLESISIFESKIQQYLEVAKQQNKTLSGANKSLLDVSKAIVALVSPLLQNYFENPDFLAQIAASSGASLDSMNALKQLSQQLTELAMIENFDPQTCRQVLLQLAQALTSQGQGGRSGLMNYEFRESGLLEAIELFLTRSPKQVQLIKEKEKSIGEEMKHSEELMLSQMVKNVRTVTKREARAYIQRLKLFAHIMFKQVNNLKPIDELVSLCHEQMSQNESLLFNNQSNNPSDPFSQSTFLGTESSLNALRQLNKRIRVNLIYDPNKQSIGQFAKPSETTLKKAQSHIPAFMNLAASDASLFSQSKVFLKRNFLFQELKQVLISVELCASLFLLEDFLRNRVKNVDDVKNLRAQLGSGAFGGAEKNSFGSSSSRREAMTLLEKSISQISEVLQPTKPYSDSAMKEFTESLSEQLKALKDKKDQQQVVRMLESHLLQVMDDFYSELDSMQEEQELNLEERLLSGQNLENLIGGQGMSLAQQDQESKLIELHRIIDKVKNSTVSSKSQEKAGLQKIPSQIEHLESEGSQLESSQMESQIIVRGDDAEMEDHSEAPEEESKQGDDIDMTDEEEEQRRKLEDIIKKRRDQEDVLGREVQLSITSEHSSSKEHQSVEEDLEKLIKDNGEDIEFEFYYNGKLLTQTQTIYDVIKESSSQESKVPGSNMFGSYSESTIYFLIKDKGDELKMSRKDSIMEFTQKRERTKSEAVNDLSNSSINHLVQELISREFCVFKESPSQQAERTVRKSSIVKEKELEQLEQALKIIKSLYFLVNNYNLLTSQGIRLLLNKNNEEQEQSEEGFSDLDLQVGVSEINPLVFCHHKLDAYILKKIQDPYQIMGGSISDLLQQVLRNCPFLFSLKTRQLFFKLVSFISSIDLNRSFYYLRQFLKQKHGKIPEDKNAKIQKQRFLVERTRIFDSAMSIVKQVNKRMFLEIQYKEEPGTGLGPTLEFYCLIAQDIKNYKDGVLWRKSMSDNSLFPSPISVQKAKDEELKKLYEVFRMVGVMMAKSISDDRLIDLPLSSLFWDLVLGKKLNLFDLERLDKDLFKVLSELQMLANKKREIEKLSINGGADEETRLRALGNLRLSHGAKVEDLGLSFTYPGQQIELKFNGSQEDVTLENLQEYIDLVMHYLFHETIKIQIQAFRKGFNSIFPVDTLNSFSTQVELEDMICGVSRNNEEWTNSQKLQDYIVPAYGYHSKSAEYLNFIKFMGELTAEDRRKFLKFVTGSPRLPNGGFAALDPKLTLVLKKPMNPLDNPDEILPSVMTCQNFVKMPSYSTYEALKSKFELAYNEGGNNFTLS